MTKKGKAKPKASELLRQYRELVSTKLDKSVKTLQLADLGMRLKVAVDELEADRDG